VHHDGYPLGAADKFRLMLEASEIRDENRKFDQSCHIKSGLAGCFLIGNKFQAYFTDSHEAHGDTEYQYTITESREGIHLLANGRYGYVFNGSLHEFLNPVVKIETGKAAIMTFFGLSEEA
jgi:hypothetical protein